MIYVRNIKTGEHRRYSDATFPITEYQHEWEVIEADSEGWIHWNGMRCPLPNGSAVEYQMRDGVKARCHSAEKLRWASSSDLGYAPFSKDIIAYRPILDADPSEPEAPAWNGEGLPPVGCECEVKINNQKWEKYQVVGYFDKTRSVFLYMAPYTPEVYEWDDCDFRPIRGKEDRAVEEMLTIIEDAESAAECCKALYRAGYRRQAEEKT